MQGLAFAALYDRTKKRNLVERLPVSMALSASALVFGESKARMSRVVGVVLPAANGAPALPETYGELSDISGLYSQVKRLEGNAATVNAVVLEAANADVLHIAGHTDRPDAAGDDALLFARAGGGTERVSWRTAASLAIGRPVVVLAACESLRVAPSLRAQALSVGGGFLAAGASAVVGTIAPVADGDARELFRVVHHELARGAPPAVAVQRAQLDALRRGSPAWRAVTVLLTRVSSI